MTARGLRIVSWNVNGLRSVAGKGFADWLDTSGADIVGLQETRALPEQVPQPVIAPPGWHVAINPAERKGYSGVALYSRMKPDAIETSLGVPEFDVEGRLQIARFGALTIANVYFPNGSGKDRDNSRVGYKIAFYRALFDALQPLRDRGEPVLVMGDFNTAHRPIDLARPKGNEKTSGFLPEEREELDRWLEAGWVDTYRALHPERVQYSWWSNRPGVRERNVGWRIDYVFASAEAAKRVRHAFIDDHVQGSDHCPVGVEFG